ncbi:MAG TPA: glyoxalase [Gammaproteobacteria bacterium]|jgi:predicted enzyme related to lactoylglutathione lyase|nr:glyoxalase [Gammaproteobacteria bacterium]HIF86524.1 glyoxalase [Gammaproteobacteria bacterium]HIN90842.1 glyoxalase [Porticoccaceae bacterium]
MTITRISHLTVYVDDQDEALRWYQDNLGFEVCMDNSKLVPELRWLTVSPAGNRDTQIVLMPARNDDEKSRVGSNLITVLNTDDCRGDMARLAANGVEIVEAPAEVPWGVSGVIRDLYGNPYNLVGPE